MITKMQGIILDHTNKIVFTLEGERLIQIKTIKDLGKIGYDTDNSIQDHDAFSIFGILEQYGIKNLYWHYIPKKLTYKELITNEYTSLCVIILMENATFIHTLQDIKENILDFTKDSTTYRLF